MWPVTQHVGNVGRVEISESCNLQNHCFGKINIGQAVLLAREKEDVDKMSPEH